MQVSPKSWRIFWFWSNFGEEAVRQQSLVFVPAAEACAQQPGWHSAGSLVALVLLSSLTLLRAVFRGPGWKKSLSVGSLWIQMTHLAADQDLKMYLE